ncbi:hypothetical protein BH20ACT11_BH20ACT11_09160 [soil metagenome]
MANYLKLMEVAHRLGISERTARRYVTRGELPSVYVGGSYRVSEEALDEYLRLAEVRPRPKAPAQPSEAGTETALAYESSRHYRGVARQAHESCAYWEFRLDESDDLSNAEILALASVSRTIALSLEAATNAELRDLGEQYPEDGDLRSKSVLEPARFRWVGFIIRVSKLELFRHADPEARRMVREAKEEIDALDKDHARVE